MTSTRRSAPAVRSAARSATGAAEGVYELRTATSLSHLLVIKAYDQLDENFSAVRDRVVRQCHYWVRSRAAISLDAICAVAEELLDLIVP